MKKIIVSVSIITTLLLASIITTAVIADDARGPAPNFSLQNRQGQSVSLQELKGEVVMINFWASWCAPCREEMPLLNTMYEKYKPLGFTLLGVNVEEDSEPAKALLKEIAVNFPILFDNKNEVSKMYNLVAMPSSVFVDRNGNIRYVHAGYKAGDEAEYHKYVRSLIRE